MKGPFNLIQTQIDTNALPQPGGYILVNTSNNAIYVGRSDSDLRNRLSNHLPENETNACINRSGASAFYVENTQTSREAYLIECSWYHRYRPTCNIAHPDKPSTNWYCPICRL